MFKKTIIRVFYAKYSIKLKIYITIKIFVSKLKKELSESSALEPTFITGAKGNLYFLQDG